MINIKTMDEGYTLDEVKTGDVFQPWSSGLTYMKCSSGDFVDLETGILVISEDFYSRHYKNGNTPVTIYRDVELKLHN